MKLPITTTNKINNPLKGFGYAFIDAEDNKLKIKKYDGVIEFTNNSSDIQLLDLIDYTAFEVWPNSKTYLPGETISNTNTYMDGNVVGYGKRLEGGKVTVEGIPSGNMHRMRFQSAIEPSKCDVIIDWGDGTIQSLKDHTLVDTRPTDQSEADMSCVHYYYEESGTHEYDYQVCHEYIELDKIYTVKIYGKDYWSICHNEIKGESNIISRVFTNDLPIASHLTCFNQFLNGQIRLFNIDIPAHHSKQFHSLNGTFGWCLNLRKVTGLAGLNTLYRFSNLFNNCKELIYTDFQIPGYISYKSPFGSLFANCEKLSMNILDIFPVNNFVAGTKINISNAFYNCKLISCSDFEKLGQMLWNNTNNIFVTSNPFAACSNEFRSHVPASWGGTASNEIIIQHPWILKNAKVNEDYEDNGTDIDITLAKGGYRYDVKSESLFIQEIENSPLEIEIYFQNNGSAPGHISFPPSLKWIGNKPSEAELNKAYLINIRNNIAVCNEVS